jgi:branched-chain amino acid transport system permease protein
MRLLSGDPPRGWPARALVLIVTLALASAPFLFSGSKPLGVAEKICVMAALGASYDVLLGYTGIVSFAHVMFFGIGAYGVGLALYALGAGWGAMALGVAAGLALAALLALAIGVFSLRVQAIFFAMVTLAVAYAFNVLASQLPDLTGGEDGRTFRVPEALRPGAKFGELFGVSITGRTLGYRIVFHRTLATVIAALAASLAGSLDALWLRYVGPDTALSFSIQIDVLVIVVIGGRGTLYGSVIGAAVFVIAENYLRAGIGALSQGAADLSLPLLPNLLHPDRWLLWLGLLFILAVRFAPRGIVGELATLANERRARSL